MKENPKGEQNEKHKTHRHIVGGVHNGNYFLALVPGDCECLRRAKRSLDSKREEASDKPIGKN